MTLLSFLPHDLPPHCTPTNTFLRDVSIYFGICVPTPWAFISTVLGSLSILSWLFAQMPQIYKNYHIKSTAGLSIFFLAEWLMGDLTNLLGAIFTQQAGWQVIIASYYTFVDVCLVVQFFWYTHVKRKILGTSLHSSRSSNASDSGSDVIGALSPINADFSNVFERTEMQQSQPERSRQPSKSPPLFSTVDYERGSIDVQTSTPKSKTPFFAEWMASPKTVVYGTIASLATPANSSPLPLPLMVASTIVHAQVHHQNSSVELAGKILSWCSTLLYLGSRLPQLYKNWRRKSTAGLSPLLFIAAFCGNFFYSSSMVTNPNAWSDFGPYGGHGWADEHGSRQADWVLRAAPFFLGAAGVLFMDAMMGLQFLLYSEREEELVKVRDAYGHSRWEVVNGWMRGWIPSMSSKSKVVDLAESQRLLAESREIERLQQRSYGAQTY